MMLVFFCFSAKGMKRILENQDGEKSAHTNESSTSSTHSSLPTPSGAQFPISTASGSGQARESSVQEDSPLERLHKRRKAELSGMPQLDEVEGSQESGVEPPKMLSQGVLRGSLFLIQSALSKGAPIEAKDNAGRTALHIAATLDNADCLRVLLDKGAQIEAKDKSGKTALHQAAWAGHQNCLRTLLEKGAKIEDKDYDGRTALSIAALKGHLKCLRALLENGAQIEAKNDFGLTAFHHASMTCNIECLRALFLAGAHIIEDGASFTVRAPSEDKVRESRRRLKVALLAFRYAGSDSEGAKSENPAGDLITSNSYLRSWIFLSHPEIREDVFTVLMSLLAEGKKVDDPLFKQAQEELGDYLVIRLRDMLNRINTPKSTAWLELHDPLAERQNETRSLCDPDLVEQNFGDVIRNSIRKRYRELYLVASSQGTTASSSS